MSVFKHWNSYRREVLHFAAGPTQIIETRRAFYAGAASVISDFIRATDSAAELIEIRKELDAWIKDQEKRHQT